MHRLLSLQSSGAPQAPSVQASLIVQKLPSSPGCSVVLGTWARPLQSSSCMDSLSGMEC